MAKISRCLSVLHSAAPHPDFCLMTLEFYQRKQCHSHHYRKTMASSSFATVVFEPNQVSSSVSADASLRFLEEHGFFYQENAAIGNLVDELYSQGRARSDDARLKYFLPTLNQDPVSRI